METTRRNDVVVAAGAGAAVVLIAAEMEEPTVVRFAVEGGWTMQQTQTIAMNVHVTAAIVDRFLSRTQPEPWPRIDCCAYWK